MDSGSLRGLLLVYKDIERLITDMIYEKGRYRKLHAIKQSRQVVETFLFAL